jgi:RNA polymerase sigma factor (sigma-70 family)
MAEPAPAAAFANVTDRSRLEALCHQHYPKVQQLVHQMLAHDVRRGRPWLAAVLSTGDVVQEVFLGVVRDFDGFRGDEGSFVAYLARLVRNRMIDSLRHHEASGRDQRRHAEGLGEVLSESMSPFSQLRSSENANDVQRILATLKDRDRALLRGRIEDGESFQQLATALGYASADSARKAFCAIQAKLLARLPDPRRPQ